MLFSKITSLALFAALATAAPVQPEKRSSQDDCFGGVGALQNAANAYSSAGWTGAAADTLGSLLSELGDAINRANNACSSLATLENEVNASYSGSEQDNSGIWV